MSMASILVKDKKASDFILVPRREYEKLLDLRKTLKSKLGEIKDTNSAVKNYLQEKKQKKLKVLKSLADLS
ncbi:MAG: hypothetical protein HYT38_02900 [Candidatus Sungbacteria bacterium]|uniref:Uncharacterized protein n=1 Tax=Candidatus Sungiibacteriota bacterium TaxID=2750080 RepID=A0A931YD15_9BACT|nr:hypothetical protein [Candidatus Sungbacteria bacterium]MBI2465641.1 hypothetical protein [Candidatus Sungbacteria bacterium]